MGKELALEGEHRWAASMWKTVTVLEQGNAKKSPRDAVLVFSMLEAWQTITIALENRNDHVNSGAAILVWVSALEKLCTRVH